jgi:hypothetical protein
MLWGVIGFVLGMLTILLFLYLPSQQLLMQREQAINDMAKFNREEQERIRELRDVSTGEMLKWLAMAEKTNTEFQKIQQSLHEQERTLADPGWFYITAMMILVTSAICFYIWVNWNANTRDTATLENFETFFTARIEALADGRPRIADRERQNAIETSTPQTVGEQSGEPEPPMTSNSES